MAIRLSGLTSGMDTDAIVQELVKAYSTKTEKYEKQQTKLTWKQDAWKSLNTKIYSLYTSVSNMRMSGSYNLRKTSISDNTKATVTANSDAVTGTQRLNILQTAQASYITGGKLGDNVTADTKMSELGYTGGNTSFEVESNDGKKHEIKIQKGTTVKEVINQLKEAGLNASFDATNKRIFVSAKESGTANDFNLYGTSVDSQSALSALGLTTALTTTDKDGNTIFTEAGAAKYQAGYDLYMAAEGANISIREYLEKQIEDYKNLKTSTNPHRLQISEYEAEIKKHDELVAQRDARQSYENINSAIRDAGIGKDVLSADQMRQLAIAFGGKEVEASDISEKATELGVTLTEDQAASIAGIFNSDEYKADVEAVANYKGSGLLSTSAATLTAQIEAIDVEDMKQKIEDEKAAMAKKQAEIDAHPYKDLVENNTDATKLEAEIEKLVDAAKEAYAVFNNEASANGGATKITGKDAIIKLNGVEYTSATNSFAINGITINAQAVTGDGDANAVTITTNVDTQGIYDKIKDFLTEYNNVINEMTRLYNADSASDYEPLTDEEKEAMSDEQIEKWENKIKESLLRRDGNLNSIISAMVNSVSQSYEVDGQKLSLGTFGISTLGFLNSAKNEHYALHIDGDKDDENTSGKKDKLMKAIEENPDQLMGFMQKLMGNLYESIDKKMKSTELSSAYKVYNDKELDKEATRIEQQIKKWEDKISDKEEYYYDKFTQMEVALSKLQSQTSSISGLLGGGM